MGRIVIENMHQKTMDATSSKTLLAHFQDEGLDWLHACGAKGRCTTCKVVVVSGEGNLSPMTPAETRYAALGALQKNERLSCQAQPTGDVRIRVPRSSQLPHESYSDEPAGT